MCVRVSFPAPPKKGKKRKAQREEEQPDKTRRTLTSKEARVLVFSIKVTKGQTRREITEWTEHVGTAPDRLPPLELGMQTQARSPSQSSRSGEGTQWGLAPQCLPGGGELGKLLAGSSPPQGVPVCHRVLARLPPWNLGTQNVSNPHPHPPPRRQLYSQSVQYSQSTKGASLWLRR